ncbi:unnamed protein product, partial [Pylaiella littoralis]
CRGARSKRIPHSSLLQTNALRSVTSSSSPVPGATALSLRQLQQNTAAGLLLAPYAQAGAAWPAGSPTTSVVGTRCLNKQSNRYEVHVYLCGAMKCINDMSLEERSAQLHFRDAAALKSRTHVACSAPAESCGAGTSCLAQDGTSKLSGKCPHGRARHFLSMRVPCPEGCGDVHGAAAQGASGACTPRSGVPKEGVKSPGLSAGGDGGQEGH